MWDDPVEGDDAAALVDGDASAKSNDVACGKSQISKGGRFGQYSILRHLFPDSGCIITRFRHFREACRYEGRFEGFGGVGLFNGSTVCRQVSEGQECKRARRVIWSKRM